MKLDWKNWFLAMFFLTMSVTTLQITIADRSSAAVLKENTCETEEFREQCLKPALYEEIKKRGAEGGDFGDILTATMLQGNFYPREVREDKEVYLKYKQEEFLFLRSRYNAVWADADCFPIPSRETSYEDTFGEPRNYGGERTHEGTDIFGRVSESGYYPVLSMTDGVVEQKGWLPLGGCRVGVRSEHGAYFYYAHLSEYEKDIDIGDAVSAGDILGYMGSTGYGPEGTVGQFPVHLHLGIYIDTPSDREVSVNPYWLLRAISKKIVNYSY